MQWLLRTSEPEGAEMSTDLHSERVEHGMVNLSHLPQERRRVVVPLSADDYRSALRDPDLLDTMDHPEAVVLSLAEMDANDPVLARLRRSNKVRAGALLIQSPFDPDQYEPADSAVAEFAVTKFVRLSELCALLGAKSVSVEQVRTVTNSSGMHAKVQAKAAVHSGHVDVDSDLTRKINERLTLKDTFAGGSADVAAARALLARVGLEDDSTLVSLVDMRSGSNPLKRRQITLNLTQEAQQNLKLAGEYSGLRLVKVSANFSKQAKEQVQVMLTATIEFS
ncbi:hypothetical protein [Geodermatophilus sp. SYSU D01119]